MSAERKTERAGGALLVGLGVLLLLVYHATAYRRLRTGGSYVPIDARELGFLACGVIGAACGVLILVRGGFSAARRRSTVEVAFAGLPLLIVAALLLAGIAAAFYSWPVPDLFLKLAAGGFFVFVFGALGVYGRRLVRIARGTEGAYASSPSPLLRVLLAAALPLNVVVMSHGCGFPGCNPTCEVMTYGAAGLAALAAFEAAGGAAAVALLLLLTAYAWPHCTCHNPINGPWIDRIGVSPNCFAFAMLGGFFAVAGLRGIWPRISAALALVPLVAAAAFAIGHHGFDYPW